MNLSDITSNRLTRQLILSFNLRLTRLKQWDKLIAFRIVIHCNQLATSYCLWLVLPVLDSVILHARRRSERMTVASQFHIKLSSFLWSFVSFLFSDSSESFLFSDSSESFLFSDNSESFLFCLLSCFIITVECFFRLFQVEDSLDLLNEKVNWIGLYLWVEVLEFGTLSSNLVYEASLN